jgi:hypothetical protein
MAMLQIWIFESLPFQSASHYAAYITYTVSVCPLASSVEPADRLLRLKEFTHNESHLNAV